MKLRLGILAAVVVAAIVIASVLSMGHGSTSPSTTVTQNHASHVVHHAAKAAGGHVSKPTTTSPAATANPKAADTIPQANGGDHDADNNGGPSDGDGNL